MNNLKNNNQLVRKLNGEELQILHKMLRSFDIHCLSTKHTVTLSPIRLDY